eukprot:GHVT01000626.1.p1 GENE.GHVT01000626.1~~GHVT01000626.1.p1  ORF type:complete len:186 (-),score=21.31 GHVT01000626.1:172-729(-)
MEKKLERVYITWPTDRILPTRKVQQLALKDRVARRVWLAKDIAWYKNIAHCNIPPCKIRDFCKDVRETLEKKQADSSAAASPCSSADGRPILSAAKKTRLFENTIADIPERNIRTIRKPNRQPYTERKRRRYKPDEPHSQAAASSTVASLSSSGKMNDFSDCESSSSKTPRGIGPRCFQQRGQQC